MNATAEQPDVNKMIDGILNKEKDGIGSRLDELDGVMAQQERLMQMIMTRLGEPQEEKTGE